MAETKVATTMFEPELETMPSSDLRALQSERLVAMVRYAYDNVPLYRRRFEEAGLTPDDIKGLDDLPKIPFTVKDDLRDHYPYGILAVPREEVVRFHASSGTTGKPTVVSYTARDLDTWSRMMARTYASAGTTKADLVQNIYGYGLFTGGLGFHYGAERLGATVLPTSTGNTKKQLMLMRDLQSTVVACTPSYAVFLAEAAVEEGYDPRNDFALRIGTFGAEPWSEEARQKLEAVFGIRAYDCYGMSELYGPGVAVECSEQNGLHIWSDEFLAETIDPETQEPLPPGELGEMVFTMLTREAMPLLRYRTRDLARIVWDECPCGRTHPRIMRISGRDDDMLIVGGVNVFPSQIEEVLMSVPELGDQYEIIVDRDLLDKLSVRVEVAPGQDWTSAPLAGKVAENLTAVLSIRALVELLEPGTIERSLGKARRVIDLRTS
ncbi:MAG: phenylacetate--CoA ligase family protein [Anaerolineae bacterium]